MNQDKSESASARYRRLQEEWRKAVRASELVPAAKLVLHALQDYQMQKRGTAWPGQGTLADECGLSRRTVASALKSGREAGFIVPVGSESKGGRYGSVVYAFEIPGDPVQPVTFGTSDRVKHTAHGEGDRVKQAAHGEGDRVKQAAHGKGSPCAIQRSDRVKQAAHKPLIEPPKDITPKSNHPKMKKESAMRVDVTRQPGKPGFFHMERSTKSDDRMFISSPYTAEMTREEAMSLIEALIVKAEEIWPEIMKAEEIWPEVKE